MQISNMINPKSMSFQLVRQRRACLESFIENEKKDSEQVGMTD